MIRIPRLAMRLAPLVLLSSTLLACSSSHPSLDADATVAAGRSTTTITMSDAVYTLATTCYDAGAGSVVAIGTGTEPHTARPMRALVQAFLTESYVGLTIGDREEVYESSLDDVLQLSFDNHVILGEGIHFVRNLDLSSGHGELAGDGSVRVDCVEYASGLPPGYTR